MATYEQIRRMGRQLFQFTPKSCWIAHVKEMNGLNPQRAHNRRDREIRLVPCPPGKRRPIEECMRFLGMI